MKIYYIPVVCLLLSLFACDKFLEIAPKEKFIPTTVEDYENMLNDMTLVTFGDYFIDLLTDDAFLPENEPGNLFSKQPMHARRIYTFNKDVFAEGTLDFLWSETYKRLFYFNTVIENIMDAEGDDMKRKKSVRAEALFGRALEHLLLVNVYARHYDSESSVTDPGVPLVLVADISSKHKRNTVREVYDQIIADLNEAIEDLPEKSKITKFRANKAGGWALLSKVYLYMGDYNKALEFAEKTLAVYSELADMNEYEVIAPGPFEFVPATPVGWTSIPDGQFHPESIVSRHFLRPFGLGQDVCASEELSRLFDNNDMRWLLYYANGWPPAPPYNYWDQYKVKIYLRGDYFNNCLTTPDIYLVRAECKARINDQRGALDDINRLRKHRIKPDAYEEFTVSDFDGQEEVLLFVLEERRRELAFTGNRHIDLKRLNKEDRFKKKIFHTAEGKEYVLDPGSDAYLRQIWPDAAKFNPDWVLN